LFGTFLFYKTSAEYTTPLILPNGVLSGLSAAALRYFADTRLLKEALDVIAEERKWLEKNTAQAKTHFGSSYAAGVAVGKTLVDAGKGWAQRASEIMFQDSGKLKIDIVTMTRQPARKLTLLAVELDQIWSEDMQRDPSRVGGFSACLGCVSGCSDCSAGLPFFAAHDLCSTVSTVRNEPRFSLSSGKIPQERPNPPLRKGLEEAGEKGDGTARGTAACARFRPTGLARASRPRAARGRRHASLSTSRRQSPWRDGSPAARL
jgi:hypothetical protein